jgi:hypothetical protein
MLIRTSDEQLLNIKRSNYSTDKQYYYAIFQIIKLFEEKYSSFQYPKEELELEQK